MSDSIENQVNQYTLEQNSSPKVPAFRSKGNKNKILAAVALIMLLAVGAISSFILLGQKQDTRNQASVAGGLVNIRLQKSADCTSGQTCSIDVIANTGRSNIDALQAKITFDQNSINTISDISFKEFEQNQVASVSGTSEGRSKILSYCKAKAGFSQDKMRRYCSADSECPENQYCDTTQVIAKEATQKPILALSRNEISSTKEVMLVWTLSDTNIPFNSNDTDIVLGKIEFKTNTANIAIGKVILSLDQTFSKATLYKTGQDSLNTPVPLSIDIVGEPVVQIQREKECSSNADCSDGFSCHISPQVTPVCPSNGGPCMAPAIKSINYCEKNVAVETNATCKNDSGCKANQYCYFPPQSGQSTTAKTADGALIKEASIAKMVASYCKDGNRSCQTNADCPQDKMCYQPPMPTCREGMTCAQVMPAKYCKESNVVATSTPTMTPTITPTTTPTVAPTTTLSPTPTAVVTQTTCAIPDCKNGTIKLIKQQTDYNQMSSNARISKGRIIDAQSTSSCPTYVCEQIVSCQYGYSEWSECDYGVKSRKIAYSSGSNCSAPIIKQSCERSCSSDSNCSRGESCSLGYCKTIVISSDLNDDGEVNVLDLSIVIKNLFTNNEKADINKDKTVDIADYSLVLKNLINREPVIAY